MAMTLFTEAYKKARKVFRDETFADGWEEFLKTEISVGALMGATGPVPAHAAACEKLRDAIDSDRGEGFFNRLFKGEGAVIWDAAGDGTANQAERAAAIKFLRHLYRASKRGAQDVWIYNPPKAHRKFIFDVVKGGGFGTTYKLAQKTEIYKEEEMRWMCSALAVALAAAQKAQLKISSADDAVKQKVRDWFCDDHASEPQLNAAMTKIKSDLPKIVSACNSNQLVFSDDPTSRKSRRSTYGLGVIGGEKGGFPVIYLEGLFTRMTGNSGKMWLCAETIIHELSHTELSTKDIFYDHHGLKPTGNKFPARDARKNADTWGYFVMDMDGKISDGDKNRVLVSP